MYDKLSPDLQQRVSKQLEYWSGTLHSRLMQRAMDTEDLEALKYHLTEAEREYAIQEDFPIVAMPRMDSALVNIKRLYGGSND